MAHLSHGRNPEWGISADATANMSGMSGAQNNGTTTGGITGKGFRPGQSGNPGGRPKGLAKATRELVGEDGMALVELWLSIAMDPLYRAADRLRASELLAKPQLSSRSRWITRWASKTFKQAPKSSPA